MKYKKSVYKTLALISQLGISILVPIVGMAFLGSYLRDRFHLPVFLLCLLSGILAGGRNAWVIVKGAMAAMEKETGHDPYRPKKSHDYEEEQDDEERK